MIAEKRFIWHRTGLDIPLLILLGITLVSLLFSIDLHISWYGYYSRWNGGLLSLLSYSLLYWAAVSNLDRKVIPLLIKCLLGGSLIVAIYATLEHLGFSPSCLVTRGSWGVDCWVQDVKNRVFATLGQPNWLAAYLVALIWLPLSQVGVEIKKVNKSQLAYLGLFGLLFVTTLFTKSRSGLLAFAISAAVYWGLAFQRDKGKIKNYLVLFVVSCGLLTLLIHNPVRDLVFKSQTSAKTVGPALEVGGTESGAIRKIVWAGAIRIWRGSTKNLLLGTGPETFAEAYYQFRPVEHNLTSEWELLYNKAHNEFLNQLATTGLVGSLAYLFLLAAMLTVLVKKYLQANDADKPLHLALLAGWISIPITNFWGFSVVITQLLLWLIPALAIINSLESQPQKDSALSTGQKVSLLIVAGLSLYLIYLTGKYWLADTKFAAASNSLKGFQTTLEPSYLISSYKLYTQAYALNPAEPAISSELAVAAAYVASSLAQTDATSAAKMAQISVAASDQAITTSPHHPNYYRSRSRAMILLSALDPTYLQTAAEALKNAITLSPTDPRIHHNLGVVEEYLGATPSAILEYQKALELKPDFADPKERLKSLVH